jgi:N-acetylglucosaminyldiphosphoundecaprenol N-acetyl-beta-D-mannosaminyltransferase
VFGVRFDPLGDAELAGRVCAGLAAGTGGWVTVPDIEVMARAMNAPMIGAGLASADLVVASGTAMAIASRMCRAPLPAPSGAVMIWSLCAALRTAGRSVYLLGGEPEEPGRREGAHRAAAVLSFACPGIVIAGHASPRLDAPGEGDEFAAISAEIVEARPDAVIVGLDAARQGWLTARLRPVLPATWFIGWAPAIEMMTGTGRSRRRLPEASRTARLLARAAARRLTGATPR